MNNDIKLHILDAIEKDLLLVTFHGVRVPHMMIDVNNDTGKEYRTNDFCEQILVSDRKDISQYLRQKLMQYMDTGKENIFSSFYRSSYSNQFMDTAELSYHNFLRHVLEMVDYDWLRIFNNLNLKCWDDGSTFVIDIKPFNKLKMF